MKFWVFWDFCISLPPPLFPKAQKIPEPPKFRGNLYWEFFLGNFSLEIFYWEFSLRIFFWGGGGGEFLIGNFFIGNFSLGFFLRKKKFPIFYWEFSLGNSDGAFGNLQPRIRIWKNLGILGSSLQNSKEKAGNFGMKPSKFQGKSEKFGLFWDPSSGIPGKNLGILGIKLPEFLG